MEIERKELFRAVVGSWNYNLNTEESDKDWKVFVLPTFDDLYEGKFYSKSTVGEKEDCDCHDIRKVNHLWTKSNINFIEPLFSGEIIVNPDLDSKTLSLLQEIFAMKESIARMNLPYLYDACIGMCHQKIKLLDKGTEGTQHLVDKYGYDTKQGQHALRVLFVLMNYANNGFTSFKDAILENGNRRNILLNIKNGAFAKDEILEIVEITLDTIDDNYKHDYKKHEFDKETNEKLRDIVKRIVRINLN